MAPAGGTTVEAKELTLQAKLEQLEAAIEEGHEIVSQISPTEGGVAEDKHEGAIACADRCMSEVHRLNNRLRVLHNQIGTI